jgi:1-acyl-sn-glycerol-3-phosphate acyltransferase
MMKIFGVTMDVEGLEEMRDEPFILLIKHTSMADTTLPLFLFSVRRGTRLRYVLKEEMLNNPLFNIVARMFPNIFIKRGSGDSESQYQRIAKLSGGLNPGDGVVIFPEGTRFSDEKRDRVQKKLAKSTNALLKGHAARIKNILPLRAGGAAALIENAPNAHVLFCGHIGFEGSRTMRHLWRGALIGNKIKVEFWSHAPESIPKTKGALEAWLYDQWERVDAWVTEAYNAEKTEVS